MGPKAFLDRWFGLPDLAPYLAPAMADLGSLGAERPELSEATRALGKLITAAFDGTGADAISEGDWEAMRGAWSIGQPSFRVYIPRFGRRKLVGRLRRLVEAAGPEVESSGPFVRAIDSKKFDLLDWVAEILEGRPVEVARRAEGLGIDPAFASSILQLTLLPSLARISAILDRMRPEGAWDRGDCPHCGSRPLLAESRGLEQRIFYRCGLCAADWPGERLRCPSCGETGSKALDYSFVEGEQDRYRLAHCDTCAYDWKVVSTLTALTPPAMIVADLATVHLDLLAADRRGELP